MIVEEIKMPARQSFDFGEGLIYLLGIKTASALEKRDLVTEIAGVRAASGNDDRVWNEVEVTLYEVASNRRNTDQRSYRRAIYLLRFSSCIVLEKRRPGIFAGSQKDCVGVHLRFLGKGSHV